MPDPRDVLRVSSRPVADEAGTLTVLATVSDAQDVRATEPLTEQQIEDIAEILRSGRRLPSHLFPFLFENPKEYHLAYRGKARPADVIADTLSVPLQPARTFGHVDDSWSDMLVNGDNLQVLRSLLDLKEQGLLTNADGSRGVRVCYVDPPFATKQEFTGSRNERAYSDHVAGAEFVEHLRRRIILIRELLADDGVLFVHLDSRKVHYMKIILDEVFGEQNFQNEIIWKRTSAHSGAKRFAPVHDTILFYSKSAQYVWNQTFDPIPQETVDQWYNNVEEETGRHFNRADLTAKGVRKGSSGGTWSGVNPTSKGRHWAIPRFVGELVDGLDTMEALDALDAAGRIFRPKKVGGMPMLKRYLDESPGIPSLDVVMDVKPLNNVSSERSGYPTQKPLKLVKKLIAATSNAGDLVLDAFLGSGTTAEAAVTLPERRRWIGIDSGKFSMYVTQARLLKHPRCLSEKGFTLFNAGLYDFRTLRELPKQQWETFVLQLFQCRTEIHQVGAVEFQGYLGDDPVLIYDFREHDNATIGEDFVDDLANLCRGRLGDKCFIIAPASVVEPYEDYITRGGTQFFFLRVPYSVIAQLHKTAFSELRQPNSELSANVPIDSVGFDFIQPPIVRTSIVEEGEAWSVSIVEFESEAFGARATDDKYSELAMVLVDEHYDGEVFKLTAAHFASDLRGNQWSFKVSRSNLDNVAMAVYIDIFGNESREILVLDELES